MKNIANFSIELTDSKVDVFFIPYKRHIFNKVDFIFLNSKLREKNFSLVNELRRTKENVVLLTVNDIVKSTSLNLLYILKEAGFDTGDVNKESKKDNERDIDNFFFSL